MFLVLSFLISSLFREFIFLNNFFFVSFHISMKSSFLVKKGLFIIFYILFSILHFKKPVNTFYKLWLHFFLFFSLVFAGPGNDVQVGQLLQCVIRSIDKTRKVVYLSSDQDIVSRCVVISLWYIFFICYATLFFFSLREFSSINNYPDPLLSLLQFTNVTGEGSKRYFNWPPRPWNDG